MLDLSVTVDLELAQTGIASVAEIVSAVTRAIETDAESFEELSTRSVGWWRSTLANTSSVAGIIAAFDSSQPHA